MIAGRTVAGAAWLLGARLITRLIDFATMLLLARILMPADFGLVAIAMTLVLICEAVLSLPVIHVLVQLPTVERRHLDTAFTLSLLRGLALALVLGALAWPFARFYGDARLLPLILVLMLAPATRGMSSPAMVVFVRRIDYRRDFLIELCGKVSAFAVATALALATRSYWAIAAGSVTATVAMTGVSYWVAPYRPRLSLSAWPLFGASLGWASAAQVVSAINWQCDRLLLGRLISTSAFGRFSMASDLTALPEQIFVKTLARPLVGAFAMLRDDPERLRAAYIRSASTVLAIALPIMVGLSMLAGPVVWLLLGGKWLEAIPILQWLALAAIPIAFVAPLEALAIGLGQPRIFLRQGLLEFAVRIPLLLVAVLHFGVAGAIFTRIVTAIWCMLVGMRFVRGLVGLPMLRQLLEHWRIVASGSVMALVLLMLRNWPQTSTSSSALAVSLTITIAIAAVAYFTSLFVAWRLAGRPPGVELLIHNALSARWSKRRRRKSLEPA